MVEEDKEDGACTEAMDLNTEQGESGLVVMRRLGEGSMGVKRQGAEQGRM